MNETLTVDKILKICNGKLYSGEKDVICDSFTKDTREINPGDTYIGIKGENFDGNLFYKDAFNKGAKCVILEEKFFVKDDNYNYDKPIILVNNSIEALKNMAEYIRNNSKSLFIGVTGSVGKTSTRDMIYSVLNEGYKTLKTEGNYNNNIGLPLTILRLKGEKAAVIEMGMNNLGEIDYLTQITKPHISVITNVGTAHIGQLGSRENILKAKLEIINGMDNNGKLIINNDNDLLHEYYLNNPKNIITIGINNKSDFEATNVKYFDNYSEFTINYEDKEYKVYCPVPGEAFIYNSLTAFAVGILSNIESSKIIQGIKNFELTKNRMEIIKTKKDIEIINDAYNASVDSMKSSLEILKNKKGNRKIAVLGDMLELGDFSKKLHEEVGESVYKNNIDILVTVGKESKNIAKKALSLGMMEENIYSFDNNLDAINLLKNILEEDDTILIKASNGLRFKEIVEELVKYYN